MSQTGHKLLVVVSGSQNKVSIYCQHTKRVQQGDLLRDSLVWTGQLVEDGSVQTMVDRVQRQTLRTPFGLLWEKREAE